MSKIAGEDHESPFHALTKGSLVAGKYRIIDEIGRGGLGAVYNADDATLDRRVAIKVLPEVFTGNPERMARFEREAKLLADLNHPNIAAIFRCARMDATARNGAQAEGRKNVRSEGIKSSMFGRDR